MAPKTFLLLIIVATLITLTVNLLNLQPEPRVYESKCFHNLKMIQGAIEAWAEESGKTNGDVVTLTDISGTPECFIRPQINRDVKCPEGGIYKITRVGRLPTCTVPGHTLR